MSIWMLILGMALLTFVPRYIPFALAGRIQLPPLMVMALDYVPIAVLTTIIVQVALVRDGAVSFSPDNHYLVAAVAATVTALISRNMFLTIGVGILCYGLVHWVI